MKKFISAFCALVFVLVSAPVFAGGPSATSNSNSNSVSKSHSTTNNYNDAQSASRAGSNAVGVGINNLQIGGGSGDPVPRVPAYIPGFAPSGDLFVDTGRSINAGAAQMAMKFSQLCEGFVPVGINDDPRFQIDNETETDIDVQWVPCYRNVRIAPNSFHRDLQAIAVKNNLCRCRSYYALGTILLVTDNKEDVAEMISLPTLDRRARKYAADNFSGASHIVLTRELVGLTFEREKRANGTSISAGPSVAVLQEVLATLGISVGRSSTAAGLFQRPGGIYLVYAVVPDWAPGAFKP